MTRSQYEELVEDWSPNVLHSMQGEVRKSAYQVATSPADQAWPSANLAIFRKVWNPRPFEADMAFYLQGTTGGGNFDIGIYSLDGPDLIRLGSIGSNAVTAGQGTKRILLPTKVLVPAGEVVLAMAIDNGTAQYMEHDLASGWGLTTPFTSWVGRLWGFAEKASSFPLPATVSTLTAIGSNFGNGPPIFGVGVNGDRDPLT